MRSALTATAALLAAAAAGCGGESPTNQSPSSTSEAQEEHSQGDHRANTTQLDLDPHLPDETVTYFDPRHRVEVTYPADWSLARQTLTPHLAGPGGILGVGTAPFNPESQEACSDAPDQPQVELTPTDAFVNVVVQPDERPANAPEQPRRFQLLEQVRPVEPARPRSGQVFPWGCLSRVGVAGVWTFFGADRSVFYVTAAVGEDAPTSTRREALGVLESLRFGPGSP